MKKFIAKRLAQMLVVFVAVSMFAFSIIYFSPGDPLYLYTSPAVSSYKMSDEQLDAMRESLGLNGNVAERYVSWAGKMLQGDWGLSVSNHQPVKKQIMDKLHFIFPESGLASKFRYARNWKYIYWRFD